MMNLPLKLRLREIAEVSLNCFHAPRTSYWRFALWTTVWRVPWNGYINATVLYSSSFAKICHFHVKKIISKQNIFFFRQIGLYKNTTPYQMPIVYYCYNNWIRKWDRDIYWCQVYWSYWRLLAFKSFFFKRNVPSSD